MIEKRRYTRYDSALEVRYASLSDVGVEGYTITRNVSRGGILVPVPKAVKDGEMLKFAIDANDRKDRIAAVGKVRWTKVLRRPAILGLDAGVEFTSISPQDAARLVGLTA
jgi:Tfp pilus assembly protein PilZ